MILTGGNNGSGILDLVSVYNTDGFLYNLPSLETERMNHGCTSYMNNAEKVKL